MEIINFGTTKFRMTNFFSFGIIHIFSKFLFLTNHALTRINAEEFFIPTVKI